MSKEFICKACGEKHKKEMQSNNEGYCYICNEFYLEKLITDLKLKLAESEGAYRDINRAFNEQRELWKQQLAEIEKERDANYENYSICWKDNEYLKKQLAEKEEELKEFKSIGATPKQLQRAYQERFKYNERCCELKKQHIQNKINFTVGRLEKVKVALKTFKFNYNGVIDCCEDYVFDIIDNQIKELKEGKIYE